MESPRSFAVVGAGPAGLAAAWRLVRGGASVTVYEAREEPGGRVRTDVVDGYAVDVATQLFSSTYRHVFRLAREVGIADGLVRTSGRDALWRKGRPHALTYGSVASMAASGALPAGLKLKLVARYLPYLAGPARGLDANDPSRNGGVRLDRESIGVWGRRELGEDFIELLAYPQLATYYGALPERTSAALYHALARVGLDVKVFAMAGGVSALPRAIAAAIERGGGRMLLERPVEAVHAAGDAVRVAVAGEEAEYDGVVVAVPAHEAASMIGATGPLDEWLRSVVMAPTATLALLLNEPMRVDFFGLGVPRTEPHGGNVVAVCVEEQKLRQLVPEGCGLLVVFPSPALAPRLAESEPESVVDALLPTVEQLFPRVGRAIVRAKAYRLQHGYTTFPPGMLRRIEAFDPAWLPAGVALAGDYRVAPSVEGAVISGERAAEQLLGGLAGADRR